MGKVINLGRERARRQEIQALIGSPGALAPSSQKNIYRRVRRQIGEESPREGSRYGQTKHLDAQDLRAQIASDLRSALEYGHFSFVFDFTVTVDACGSGQILRLSITGFSGPVFSPKWIVATDGFTNFHTIAANGYDPEERFSPQLRNTLDQLVSFVNRYNRRDDEGRARFHARCGVDPDFELSEEKRIRTGG